MEENWREGVLAGIGLDQSLVEHRACVVGCSDQCCFCPPDLAYLLPDRVSTFAVAAEMHLVVIGGWAAAIVVLFCAVSAHLSLSTRHCNMAVGSALVASSHNSLTMGDFAQFGLIVMYELFKEAKCWLLLVFPH